jgi:hypothetical protein
MSPKRRKGPSASVRGSIFDARWQRAKGAVEARRTTVQ